MNSREMAKEAVRALEDKKANDIRVIDITGVSSMGDYFIIADGSNRNQVQAMSDNVEEFMHKAGAKLKNRINDAKNFVENLDLDECELILNDIRQNGSKNLGDFDVAFELDMFDIEKVFNENIVATLEDIKVAIDISTSEELEKEGILREILRGLQIMRKDAGYDVADRVILDLTTTDDLLSEIIEEEKENIQNETLSTITKLDNFDLERELNIRDRKLNVKISK